MPGSPPNPGCGEELGGEGPVWSDAGPGGTKDFSSPLGKGEGMEGKRPNVLELEGQGQVGLSRSRR